MRFDRSVSGFGIWHLEDTDVPGGLCSLDIMGWLAGQSAGAAGLSRIPARCAGCPWGPSGASGNAPWTHTQGGQQE